MNDFFIIIGIILLLLLFLYFGFKYNLNIEKFSNNSGSLNSASITDLNRSAPAPAPAPASSSAPASSPASTQASSSAPAPASSSAQASSPASTQASSPAPAPASSAPAPASSAPAQAPAPAPASASAPPPASASAPPPTQLIDENIINLLAVINAYAPKCIYHPTLINKSLDTNTNTLYNLIDKNNNAILTGNNNEFIIKVDNSGNTNVNLNIDGSINTNYKYIGKSNITYLSGTINTGIKFNSIPQNFTLCTITKYTSQQNQNTILTSTTSSVQSSDKDNNNNLWFHGHNNGLRGVVCYNKYLTNNNDNITDDYLKNPDRKLNWVVTCAKNCANSAPNNVIVNGIPIGTNQEAGVGANNNILSINSYVNNFMNNTFSNYAFSYIIMWDICLSDKCLKYVSDALIYYLNSGNELLYDYASLSPDDKMIITNRTTLIKTADFEEKQSKQLADWFKSQSISSPENKILNGTQSQNQTQPQTQNSSLNIPDYKYLTDIYNNIDLNDIINKFNDNIQNQNEYQQKILELLKLNLIKKEPNTINDTTTLSIDKVLNNIAYLDSQLSLKNPIASPITTDIINNNNLSKNKSSICSLVDKMPDPSQKSFTNIYDNNTPNPSSLNKDDQSYLWCKCSPDNNNTDLCKAFNTCRINYSNNNKNNQTSTFSTVSNIDREIYNNCTNAFPNFPRYLN